MYVGTTITILYMRYLILFLLVLSSLTPSFAQERSWEVYLNHRILLTGHDSFKENNYVIDIKSQSLDSAGFLHVECIGMEDSINGLACIRTIEIAAKKYYTLYSKESTTVLEIDNASLKKLFDRGKKLDVYTWSYPPEGANIKVKIRRIHLCTLRLR
jgi:hypothetical protein